MAANRYGQIWHGDHHHINIRFPSAEARLKFQNEFEAHHASHDHEGDTPTFKCVTTKDLKLSTGSRSPQDLVKAETDKDYRITIDGYGWSEIHEYHNPSGFSDYFWYHVPTCCVPPTIVVDREFVDSGTLERHELSAVFGDMQKDEFDALVKSVEADGFIEPFIRIYEGKILDGWHRYRAAQELNLIRKLRFQEWNEDDHRDGNPKVFVLARNIERRHLTPGQRAQIVVEVNGWLAHGDVNSQRDDVSNDTSQSKSTADLARDANVGTATINRAKEVSRAGKAEEVISGEKTAGDVLKEEALEQLYQNRQDFQTAVSDFAQSGAYLDFSYCRRRIKELIDLEDSTDEGSTDYAQWNLQKIKAQSQIAEESVLVIKGYMDEDPKIEGYPVAALLSEMQRISEIYQSAKLDTYTRPFRHQPLSDAVERIEKLWTSDWEVSKSAEERLDDLNELEAELPGLIEAEDTARADEKADVEESTEREAKKLLKQKKQKAKLLWDTRIQVARDYTGDADTELNLHLTLPELEAGFQKNNSHYALHFASAMKRTSEPSYQVMLGKILESEDVTLKVLESEVRAIQTYMGDVRQWQRPDWSPDTNWILPLIEVKKAKAADAKKTDAADTLKTLREQIPPAIAAWKSERKGQGVGHASKTMFIEATKRFHDLPQESETDVDLLEKLLSLLTEVQGRMYTFERYVKMQCNGVSIWETDETAEVPESDSELHRAQKRAATRRQRMWSYFASEIQVKHGKTRAEVSEEDFAKAAADFLRLSTIRAPKNGIEYCFGADEFILGDIASPPYALSDCTLADATMWASRFDVIAIALMNMADWVQALLEESKPTRKPEEPDYEQLQREHGSRLDALPGEIRSVLPVWTRKHAITGNVTLKALLEARCQLEFGRPRGPDPFFREEMEEVRKRMESNDADLVAKVRELLSAEDTDTDTTEEMETGADSLTDEGLAGIDVNALRGTLSHLLETLNISEMSPGFKDRLTADLLDVFLEYEEPPTTREQVVALLDAADSLLSEFC